MTRARSITVIALGSATACALACSVAREPRPSEVSATGGAGNANVAGVGGSLGGGAGASGTSSSAGSSGAGGSGGLATPPTGPISARVASWPENRPGAYSIIHDDTSPWLASHFDTVGPELAAVGLVAAFGVIVNDCNSGEAWPAVQALKDGGHEIINHSWDHTGSTSLADLALQMDQAGATMDTMLTSQQTTFYIFPYDDHDPPAIDHLRALGYLGARAGVYGGITSADYVDDFALSFDVFGPVASMYEQAGPCAGQTGDAPLDFSEECRRYVLNQYVDDSISQGGWGMREFHGVEDASWQAVPLADYQHHLSYVKAKKDAGLLWVDTPSNLIRYRRARAACAPLVQDYTLKFSPLSAECQSLARPLGVVISVQQGPMNALDVTQNAVTIAATSLGAGSFLATLDPALGDATVVAR